MMYLPFTAVTADMWRAITGRAARAAAVEADAIMFLRGLEVEER